MPAVAIGGGRGTVSTNHGCDTTTTTDECSLTVFVEGTGVVTKGDLNTSHEIPCGSSCCEAHTVALSTHSGTVFVDGKNVGRKDDAYGAEEITGVGQSSVIAG